MHLLNFSHLMQKILVVVLLLLFLSLLFLPVSIVYSYSDLRNSLLVDCSVSLHPVMAPKIASRITKRSLGRYDVQSDNNEAGILRFYDDQSLHASISGAKDSLLSTETNRQIQPRKRKQVSQLALREKDESSKTGERRDKRARSDQQGSTEIQNQGQCSHMFGQAFYQKSRRVSVVKYEDSGDNIYTCDHCNASFWFGEANKRSSSNAPLIYATCCKKGQIKLEQAKPTPTILENLLNPNNGSESRLFRENIRIYNSMFSFTSMGAAIDHKINTGSGPYVFKISGQVHHLMGSLLPSDGEPPKYAQLYIYDTKNEVLNRINALDPTHANENIKSNIVQGLIEMFDETNDLVKEFHTMRDKFENHSLHSLNMTIVNLLIVNNTKYRQLKKLVV
ncbi:uncharacterized protein LOC133731463 [Rosa rugosa]|uniref:uncharacterized protein LOC133731463 n=1 Tax=Rosa rugosa TaxID=74645 RepID=UPI002B418615|nr:uncharacterized protein LOC133731463 [Rosa rugosa]